MQFQCFTFQPSENSLFDENCRKEREENCISHVWIINVGQSFFFRFLFSHRHPFSFDSALVSTTPHRELRACREWQYSLCYSTAYRHCCCCCCTCVCTALWAIIFLKIVHTLWVCVCTCTLWRYETEYVAGFMCWERNVRVECIGLWITMMTM